MNHFKTTAFGLCFVIGGLLACRTVYGGEPSTIQASYETRGKEIVQQAFALLSSNLGKALSEAGVTNALSYCSVQALPLTKVVADTNHVRLSRVTHKPRNPLNKADREEMAVLKRFQSELNPGKPADPLVVRNADHSVTFFAPIILNNPLCLKCHGEVGKDVTPENSAYIRKLYPRDRAIGFKMGELRGMWRVDFLVQKAAN